MIRNLFLCFLCLILSPAFLLAEEASEPAKPAIAPFNDSQASDFQSAWAAKFGIQVNVVNSLGVAMTLIPPGEFLMGSSEEQISAALKMAEEMNADESTRKRIPTESPQHLVKIEKPFRMAATEVTIAQFRKFVKATGYLTEAEIYGSANTTVKKPIDNPQKFDWRFPGFKQVEDHAVSQVSWNDAVAFCNWLSAQEKLPAAYKKDEKLGWLLMPDSPGYRLPTEAEWEFAARAGTTSQYHFGDDLGLLPKYAWFGSKSGSNPERTVGTKRPNPFGLFDMHGGIGEWCQDVYEVKSYPKHVLNPTKPESGEPQRVIRGGDWWTNAIRCRSAFRGYGEQANRSDDLGFRLVRTVE